MVFVLLLLVLSGMLEISAAQSIGVCYGRLGNNLPPPQEVIDLYKSNGIGRMRIYNPDPATIQALKGTNIELMVGVPNENIQSLATNRAAATEWVQTNILTYSHDVKFKYIVVGNEINPSEDTTSQFILQAMQNIYRVLASANLQTQIRVSTAIQMGLLGASYPPSKGEFSSSSIDFITPIVNFLVSNGAPLLANVYPYFSYIGDTKNIDISFALFTSQKITVTDVKYKYDNLFDASLGALYAALEKIGAPNLEVVVSESGWPSDGGVGATIENAEIYYRNLIKHVQGGTPNRPNQAVETYLFAMFDENQKGPAETERHFGLFSPNKQSKYKLTDGKNPFGDSSTSPCLVIQGITFSFSFFLLLLVLFL